MEAHNRVSTAAALNAWARAILAHQDELALLMIGTTRSAKYVGSQGCVTLPAGQTDVTPVAVRSALGDPATIEWPMSDRAHTGPAAGLNAARVAQAAEAAFEPAAQTAAFVVTWKGRIVAERYGEGIGASTPLESWSMGKSLTATLMGILIRRGIYDLWQPAPISEPVRVAFLHETCNAVEQYCLTTFRSSCNLHGSSPH